MSSPSHSSSTSPLHCQENSTKEDYQAKYDLEESSHTPAKAKEGKGGGPSNPAQPASSESSSSAVTVGTIGATVYGAVATGSSCIVSRRGVVASNGSERGSDGAGSSGASGGSGSGGRRDLGDGR
jgi:hypothetical protein